MPALPNAAIATPEVTEMPVAVIEDAVIAFETERVGDGALLTWDVPRPAEVTNLIIEGSEDGQHFIDLESLEDAEAGVLDVFYDAAPEDRRYYRIIANYKDGRQQTTQVQTLAPSVGFSAELDAEKEGLLLVRSAGPVSLYDLQGGLITTANPQEGQVMLELDGLAHGPYLVRSGEDRKVVVY